MKILKEYAGALTNFEVLDFLRSRGAGKDPTRLIAAIAPSEYKVYDYLEQTAASRQTRDTVNEFMEKCKIYDLAKAEILNIINIRPSSAAEIDPIIEECDARYGEKIELLVETVSDLLPPPPTQLESEEGIGVDKEQTSDEHQMEVTQ
ncbi:hypothetical protein ACH5RR_031363 [Cinchona calisaya]|uniref:DNA-directed RNA polymerase III subunit RPC9 n=1 Tax=Cinchona calisaya TaxID=153742 RepID=A0ABD2YGB8_9GENT